MYYPFERKIMENILKNENPLVVLKKNFFKCLNLPHLAS